MLSPLTIAFLLVVILIVLAFLAGRQRAIGLVGADISALHSLPDHYGTYALLWVALPGFFILALWIAIGPGIVDSLMLSALAESNPSLTDAELSLKLNDVRNYFAGDVLSGAITEQLDANTAMYRAWMLKGVWGTSVLAIVLSLVGAFVSVSQVKPDMRARNRVENVVRAIMIAASVLTILVTFCIVFSLLFETLRFFEKVPITEFLFGVEWSPQTALRADQVASEGSFGAIPLFAGTLLITFIAMIVAVPIGLMSAIYMTQFADERVRAAIKPVLEVLAGVPTVVYGFFAALTLALMFSALGSYFG
ncbi:MAG: phosphate ABC transporter permease family protein, partial [Proteobacteria bacterium]|nr:phosphate ABC transporter permease family protein [Pseudomonadota bacterium]